MATIYLAGGCFWGVEKYMALVHGVTNTEAGYANGTTKSPTYEDVCTDRTGYAETVRVDYDPTVAPLPFLLDLFYKAIDPTTRNRQGNDVGPQYRSVVFYANEAQKTAAEKFIAGLKADGLAVVTTVQPLKEFYVAEDYHKNYYETHKDEPYCQLVIEPKLNKVKEKFAALLANP